LTLYDIGLRSAHAIITAAILNLTGQGAMAIAWSQIDIEPNILLHDVLESVYTVPTPIFFALSGTLVFK
jgi:hypothetical protein